MKREEAHAVIEHLRNPGAITVDGQAKTALLDCLAGMLGGDPWQEGAYAIEIVEIITGQAGSHLT